MFRSFYKLSIEGKDVKRFIRYLYKRGILFDKMISLEDKYYVLVDKDNYNKIKSIKTTYQINIVRVYGPLFLLNSIKSNFVFLISFLFSLLFLYLLCHIVFDVVVVTDDRELKEYLMNELYSYDIKPFTLAKSFDKKEIIKNSILDNNRDKLEWLEIERIGVKYIVRLDKRIIKEYEEENGVRNVVAKRDGIIKKIVANRGEIVKKVNDYVKKGDIIISGAIHKGEDVKDNVSAEGDVYAEVWYKVKVTLPVNYYEEKVKSEENIVSFNFLGKEESSNKRVKSNILFSDFFDLFSISYDNVINLDINNSINTIINESDAVNLARQKLLSRLTNGCHIISQKSLKTTLSHSTIIIEVFFKVYENISSISYYSIEGE